MFFHVTVTCKRMGVHLRSAAPHRRYRFAGCVSPKNIGRAETEEYPFVYDVGVWWEPSGERPIALGEGQGHGAAGGAFPLSEILDKKWTKHLEICDCLWLRELARAEVARGFPFLANEIWQRAQER